MYFASFVVNLLVWTFLGLGMGFFLHKGTNRNKNISVFIGSLASLAGGIFSSISHGMFPEIGIDFFNLFGAFVFSLISLYLFVPNTRSSTISAGFEIFEKVKDFVSGSQTRKSPYFNSHFWKNIASSLNP